MGVRGGGWGEEILLSKCNDDLAKMGVGWYNGTEWNCARTEFEKTACSSKTVT
jgi:hypothetical protein